MIIGSQQGSYPWSYGSSPYEVTKGINKNYIC